MNHFSLAAALALVLAFQAVGDLRSHRECIGRSEPVLCAAKPHRVSGVPVLVPNEITALENTAYHPSGTASIVTSPYFGASRIVTFGS